MTYRLMVRVTWLDDHIVMCIQNVMSIGHDKIFSHIIMKPMHTFSDSQCISHITHFPGLRPLKKLSSGEEFQMHALM